MKRFILTLIALAVLVSVQIDTTAVAQGSDYVLIVHRDNPLDSISRSQASSLLLKKRARWPGSDLRVEPVDLPGDSSVRESLSRDVHDRSVSSIKSYWQKQIFSGRNSPPPEMASDGEVVAWVRDNPGGIGYVSSRAQLDGVKAITVID